MYIDYSEVGKRLARRRRELGLKQCEVCEKADLSYKYLSNLERAISLPSLTVFMKLCEILKTTPNEILLGATSDVDSSDYLKHISSKMHQMNNSQKKLVLNFIDWVASQSIDK